MLSTKRPHDPEAHVTIGVDTLCETVTIAQVDRPVDQRRLGSHVVTPAVAFVKQVMQVPRS